MESTTDRNGINAVTLVWRKPGATWRRAILWTLGFGFYVHHHRTNRTLRDLGADVRPGLSLLAVSLGAILVVPYALSIYRTGERIAEAQQAAGLTPSVSPVKGVVGGFLGGFNVVHYQSELNELALRYGARSNGSKAKRSVTVPVPAVQRGGRHRAGVTS